MSVKSLQSASPTSFPATVLVPSPYAHVMVPPALSVPSPKPLVDIRGTVPSSHHQLLSHSDSPFPGQELGAVTSRADIREKVFGGLGSAKKEGRVHTENLYVFCPEQRPQRTYYTIL